MMYQHTQRASKHTYFAWTYHPMQCVWRSPSAALSANATKTVETNRAQGKDIAHISGMSSKGHSKDQIKAYAMKRPKLDTVPAVNQGSHMRIVPKETTQDRMHKQQKIVRGGI